MFSCDILIKELRSGLLLSELENGPNFVVVLIWHSLVFKARCLPKQFYFKLWCKIAFAVGSLSRVNEYLACFECGANFSWTGTNLFSYGRIYIKPLVLILLRERLWFQWCKSEGCHNLQKVATICKSEHCHYFFSFSKVKVAKILQKRCIFLSLPLSLPLQGSSPSIWHITQIEDPFHSTASLPFIFSSSAQKN